MIPLIIGLTGRAGAGKDVAALALTVTNEFVSMRFASAIKAGLNAMFGFSDESWEDRGWKESVIGLLSKSPRQLAQTLGTEWGRDSVHTDVWVTCLALKVQRHVQSADKDTGAKSIVIPDLRFQNEAKWIKESGGLIVEIQRDSDEDETEHSGHSSEDGIPLLLIDHIIQNNGDISELEFDIKALAIKELVMRSR